ncbi:MAG TPA: cytidylate kinase-like family protein [Candidatus Dormibacteraeota bacterium]|nr:cytidylate kinase-like family protein [Candidatus Dormibacteraeota bacterium]
MFRLITISREYGSGGTSLARRIAERLGWQVVDDPLVEEIARRAQVHPDVARRYDECVNPWFQRLIQSLWRGGFEGSASRVETVAFDADEMKRLWTQVIREAAEIGNGVIVGRGGQCTLRDRKDTFHVSLHAPLELRVRNLRQMLGREDGLAELAEVTDRRRAAYIRRYFGEDWKDAHLYHLMVNASIGLDRAADAVLAAAGLTGSAE